MSFIKVIWWLSAFIIFWTMIGYPLFLLLIDKILKRPEHEKSFDYCPSVSVMVVAHNEEKVIRNKLENLISMDYPKEKYSVVVTSDFSTDKTNELVEEFIREHSEHDIILHKTINHSGKTNAQNEAHKKVKSEILVMTDANTVFDKNAIRELVAGFADDDVMYVCGSTVYINKSQNITAETENTYWDIDSKCRDIESRLQTITAGDGNIYACRTKWYKDIPLIECHDSSFPVMCALEGHRAIYNPKAISYEKAGENNKDEYKRKVRMNRNLFHNILPSIKILNIFKYKWFTVFWLGHRTCRYLLWITHFLVLAGCAFMICENAFWLLLLIGQVVFYLIALLGKRYSHKNKIVRFIHYYVMTVASQWHAVYNILSGKTKATWSKAESTR